MTTIQQAVMMEKFPKILATFLFTGDMQALSDLLLVTFVGYMTTEAQRVKPGATVTLSIDLYQRETGRWVYYPKVMIEESFVGNENFSQYRTRVRNLLQRQLENFGCTDVVVILQ